MRMGITLICPVLLAALCAAHCAGAQEPRAPAAMSQLTVAVLDFDSEERSGLTTGAKVATLLEAYLSAGGCQLVERANIEKILKEAGLGLSGLLEENTAAKIGHLLGANVLVTGRVFSVDQEVFLAAKLIGVETGRVYGEVVSLESSDKLAPGVEELAGRVAGSLKANGALLVAVLEEPVDVIASVKEALGNAKRPRVAVSTAERHVGQAIIDPAASTELKYILLKADFEVFEADSDLLSDWVRKYFENSDTPVPSAQAKADVLIVGEALSEFGSRIGDLVSCRARVEVRAIDRRTGRLLAIGRKTVTKVDLSEQIAAKSAIQSATADIAVSLLPEAVKKWNESNAE
jgi:hypothetical protein